MRSLWEDVGYALRLFVKSPGFTAVAVLTIALGIGANSTIFSWINSTLLNPIPGMKGSGEVVSLSLGGTASDPRPFSYPDYLDLRDRNRSFSGLIASDLRSLNLTGNGRPERAWATMCTANYFDVLGVKPMLGRGFLPAEDTRAGSVPVAVISYRLWQTRYGGKPDIIGQSISLNQHPYTIVGVTPPVFQGSQTGLRTELWIPLLAGERLITASNRLDERDAMWMMLLGRLRPGVTAEQGQAEMNTLMQQLVTQYPEAHQGRNNVVAFPLWRAPYGANGYLYLLLPTLMAISGVVLLLACANVANLLLVRSVARRREMAIRLAIGASRWRLVRQLLIESLVLSVAGGGVAMLITTWSAGTFGSFIPPTNIPIFLDVHADRVVLLVTLAVSVFTGVIFGILPALRSSNLAPVAVLKEDTGSASGGRSKARLSRVLVVMQMALSLLLLVCAGLFIRSFQNAQRADMGFNPDHVLLATVDLFSAGYTKDQGIQFDRQLLAKLEVLPGVQSVSMSSWVPLGFSLSSSVTQPEGYVPRPHESMDISNANVGPNYLHTMQIPVLEGREFTPQDTESTQTVAVVNQEFVKRYWPGQNAIGKKLSADGLKFTVIGVARDSDYNSLHEAKEPYFYVPIYQDYARGPIIHMRVAGEPLAYTATLEKAIHELNADMPVLDESTLATRVQVASTGSRIAGTFVGAFGVLAMVLAAVGIYGVIAYTTRERTHEIGIRLALGAQRRDVLRLVLRQGMQMTIAGLALGVVLALVSTRALKGILFGVTATDAVTYTIVAALLAMVALAACWIPAWRAMRVDPMVALRYQ
ncbi:MAG: ABC transporter permease [Candidatus Acidiferrales bacterium]